MPFKIKDLLIDIEAAEAAAEVNPNICKAYPTYPCRFPTRCRFPTNQTCMHMTRTCPPLTRPCRAMTYRNCEAVTLPWTPYEAEDWWTPVEEGDIGEMMPQDLGALKQRLEKALEVVKAKHAELEAGVVREPTTHAEIEALETKLEGALQDLRARKAKLAGPGK